MTPCRFRAWHKDREMMLTIEIIQLAQRRDEKPWLAFAEDIGGTTPVDALEPNEPCYACDLDEVILMQSTGLTDKNGKEIFEGDIVNGYTACGWENGEVVFGKYVTDNKANEDIMGWCFSCELRFHALDPQCDWEVIGNIYENPDLLPSFK